MASVSQLIVSSLDGKFSFFTPRVSTELDLPPAPSLWHREPMSPLSPLRTDWMATPFTSEQVEWLQTTFGGTPTPLAGTRGTTASPQKATGDSSGDSNVPMPIDGTSAAAALAAPPTQTVRYVPATVVREGVRCVLRFRMPGAS